MTMKLRVEDLKLDCRHFRGDVPCRPHKLHGVHCVDERGGACVHYEAARKRILIIKLGAIGDVIRTTPLLTRLREVEPHSEIWWVTLTPEVVPPSVDMILPFSARSVAILQATPFDAVFNLDKDREACALCVQVNAPVKKGFTLRDGKCVPADPSAYHKYLTGVFDDLSKSNTKSYQEEIFEICGFRFNGEEYIMPPLEQYGWKLPARKKVIGLNTGCGGRWTSRLWPDNYWVSLAKKIKKSGSV